MVFTTQVQPTLINMYLIQSQMYHTYISMKKEKKILCIFIVYFIFFFRSDTDLVRRLIFYSFCLP